MVLEKYYNSRGADNPHDIRSATKSITALLVVIAIEQAIISDVEMPIADVLQNLYPTIEIDNRLTVADLLNMSSGKDCNDWMPSSPGNENKMYRRDEMMNAPGYQISCFLMQFFQTI